MRLLLVALVLVTAMLSAAPVRADSGPGQLVKDLNTNEPYVNGSYPENFVTIGSITYFAADDGSNGVELWRTDGSSGGTFMVADLVPGPESSRPHLLTNFNGTLYFAAGADYGSTLWTSNGSLQGTVPLKNTASGDTFAVTNIFSFDGQLFFSVDHTVGYNKSLWKSDGTSSGTTFVSASAPISALPVVAANRFYFAGEDAEHGVELWSSDGTTAGTGLVKDLISGSSGLNPQQLIAVNTTVFFIAGLGTGYDQLWRSDGTEAGTVQIPSSAGDQQFGRIGTLSVLNNTLYFLAHRKVCGECDGYEARLWKIDPATSVATTIKTIESAAPFDAGDGVMAVTGNRLYFTLSTSPTGQELWTSDGTAGETVLLKDIRPGSPGSAVSSLLPIGTKLYFIADDGTNGFELWASNGTAVGTALVKDIRGGSESSLGKVYERYYTPKLAARDGTLIFGADGDGGGMELWKSNGTAAGTSRIKAINTVSEGTFGVEDQPLVDINGTSFFSYIRIGGYGSLWKTDGTGSATTLIRDFPPTSRHSDTGPRLLTKVGTTLFFVADGTDTGRELWRSDGTTAGTVLVKDIAANDGYDYSRIQWLTTFGSLLLFAADDGIHGLELWRSDGTPAGTSLVKDIKPGHGDSQLSSFLVVDETLYFIADDGEAGKELWRSDGTEAGTQRVADINPGRASAFEYSSYMTAVDRALYFTANDGTSGRELWRTDGTQAGTRLVKDIKPGAGDGIAFGYNNYFPVSFLVLDNRFFFVADDDVHGRQLWKSDGTTGGTMPLTLFQGTNLFQPAPVLFGVLNGRVLFGADDGTNGYELWRTDGTIAGTQLIINIAPGSQSGLRGLGSVLQQDGKMLFAANDGVHGYEPWQTDGTAANTTMVQDIAVGIGSSMPNGFIISGGRVLFKADDNIHGRELWAMPRTVLPWLHIGVAGPTQTVTNADETFTANLQGTDVSGQTMYTWVVDDRTPVVQVAGSSTSFTTSFPTSGISQVTVTAQTGQNRTSTTTFEVLVVAGAQAQIGVSGGTLSYTDQAGNQVALVFAPAALDQPTAMRLTPANTDQAAAVQTGWFAWTLGALRNGVMIDPFSFGRPAVTTITLRSLPANITDTNLRLRIWQNGAWQMVAPPCGEISRQAANSSGYEVETSLCAAGTYALFGDQQSIASRTVYVPVARR